MAVKKCWQPSYFIFGNLLNDAILLLSLQVVLYIEI